MTMSAKAPAMSGSVAKTISRNRIRPELSWIRARKADAVVDKRTVADNRHFEGMRNKDGEKQEDRWAYDVLELIGRRQFEFMLAALHQLQRMPHRAPQGARIKDEPRHDLVEQHLKGFEEDDERHEFPLAACTPLIVQLGCRA